MTGIEPNENNEIYFEINLMNLLQSLPSNANFVHLKLTKKDNTPHLRIELRNITITHDIPINLQPVRMWGLFKTPITGPPSVCFKDY